ncbi:MAG TPA: hypothetical protein VFS43_15110 [Polyangiaceae bacterium]|nr:hypothetical protein [Polyangiaceae bacterium]
MARPRPPSDALTHGLWRRRPVASRPGEGPGRRAPPLAALALLVACSSGPRVRPFPELDPADLLRPADDLPGQLERAGRELAGAGLREAFRVEGKLRGGQPFVAIAAEGRDPFGRPSHALRVVTPASIVLALGPADPAAPRPDEPIRLVRHLNDKGVYPSGLDLTGDGAPDLGVRALDGTLALYRVELLSATRYPVTIAGPPREADDVSGDGRPDLLGAPPAAETDPLAPRLVDAAVGDGVSFRNDTPAARLFHRRALEAPPPPEGAPPAARLRAALERAFHAMRAGDPPARAFQPAADLAASLAPLPDELAAWWVRWRGYLADRAIEEAAAKAKADGPPKLERSSGRWSPPCGTPTSPPAPTAGPPPSGPRHDLGHHSNRSRSATAALRAAAETGRPAARSRRPGSRSF